MNCISISKAVEIRFPRFRGTSYLALPTLRDAHRSMQINIEFKPEHYDGVVLYSGEQQTLEGDFISLALNQGFAEFRSHLHFMHDFQLFLSILHMTSYIYQKHDFMFNMEKLCYP